MYAFHWCPSPTRRRTRPSMPCGSMYCLPCRVWFALTCSNHLHPFFRFFMKNVAIYLLLIAFHRTFGPQVRFLVGNGLFTLQPCPAKPRQEPNLPAWLRAPRHWMARFFHHSVGKRPGKGFTVANSAPPLAGWFTCSVDNWRNKVTGFCLAVSREITTFATTLLDFHFGGRGREIGGRIFQS